MIVSESKKIQERIKSFITVNWLGLLSSFARNCSLIKAIFWYSLFSIKHVQKVIT